MIKKILSSSILVISFVFASCASDEEDTQEFIEAEEGSEYEGEDNEYNYANLSDTEDPSNSNLSEDSEDLPEGMVSTDDSYDADIATMDTDDPAADSMSDEPTEPASIDMAEDDSSMMDEDSAQDTSSTPPMDQSMPAGMSPEPVVESNPSKVLDVDGNYFVRCLVLRIRKGPGLEHSTEGYLVYNAELKISQQQGIWIKFGENKWVSSLYVTSEKNKKPSLPQLAH